MARLRHLFLLTFLLIYGKTPAFSIPANNWKVLQKVLLWAGSCR